MPKLRNVLEIFYKLKEFWGKFGCVEILPYPFFVGAATFHSECFFRALGPDPFSLIYIQQVMRKADGRYGLSPNRLINHHQIQVLKMVLEVACRS